MLKTTSVTVESFLDLSVAYPHSYELWSRKSRQKIHSDKDLKAYFTFLISNMDFWKLDSPMDKAKRILDEAVGNDGKYLLNNHTLHMIERANGQYIASIMHYPNVKFVSNGYTTCTLKSVDLD